MSSDGLITAALCAGNGTYNVEFERGIVAQLERVQAVLDSRRGSGSNEVDPESWACSSPACRPPHARVAEQRIGAQLMIDFVYAG
jgi:hypothetical protein